MKRDSIAIPIAIVIAAGLIAGAIYFSGSKPTGTAGTLPTDQINSPAAQNGGAPLRTVDASDHIRGNPNAPIMLVEYSDFECPYCKIFHETLQRIITEYGPSGKVAWTYRQFPIAQLHPNAPKIAEASECVTSLGGDFWKFADIIFGSRGIKEFTDMTKLADYAATAGVSDKAAFQSCLNSGEKGQKVTDSINELIAVTGPRIGTPHTFIVVGDKSYPIEGAQPYDVVKKALDNMITQMNGGTVSDTAGAPAQ